MKTKTLLSGAISAIAFLLSQSASAQSQALYTDGTANGYSMSIGSTYRFNLNYVHSYLGFNVKPLNTGNWQVGTDGASNGGAMVLGSFRGDLRFITVPGVSGGAIQNLTGTQLSALSRMEISREGNVRIGEKAAIGIHSDCKLSVYGKLTAVSLYVLADNSTNWADYVFADKYHLMPLQEVEAYILKNRHLPEIPTTCDVETSGINIAAMNTLLLKKVEELTLHLIALNKEVEQLKKANKTSDSSN